MDTLNYELEERMGDGSWKPVYTERDDFDPMARIWFENKAGAQVYINTQLVALGYTPDSFRIIEVKTTRTVVKP